MSNFLDKFKNYLKTNKLMITFILTSLINEILLRYFTVNNVFSVKPIFADLAFLLFITSFGYFLKPKNQFIYLLIWSIIFSALCIVNAVYYSNYISYASVSLLKTATELGGYTDAVFENIFELKDLIFVWQIFTLIFVHIQLKRRKYYDSVVDIEKGKKRFLNMCDASLIVLGLFISMLTSTDVSRLNKQWNRPSIVMEFGIYIYQANDIVTSVRTKVNEMFGYDDAYKTFREYYSQDKQKKDNKYTNIFKNRNVIVIHGESIQNFTLNLKFNDQVLTPNINKLASDGIYFSNFYAEESVGNSSDSEFTLATSLLPSSSGTVFMNYFNRNYETIQKLLKEKGYYTFSMHGNNGSAWNRNIMYKYLGYDYFYNYTNDYEIDEKIGLGLSDKSFFRQSVEKIKKINEDYDKWYGSLIMLTNHTPFSDINNYSDYSVNINVDEEEVQWLEGTKMGNYLKSVHYADEAIGELMNSLDKEGLLDNTIIVLYGDHDCKLKKSEFNRLYESEYYNDVLIDSNNTVGTIDDFTYEINRKVPLIIWAKDMIGTDYSKEIKDVMGMIDVSPTLSNMLGIKQKYNLGNDIFSTKGNTVVFPSGNWITDEVYYNGSNGTFRQLNLNSSIDMNYINRNNQYAEKLIKISNGIITYDLINAYETGLESITN